MSTDARTLRFNDASSMELRRSGPGLRTRVYTPGSRVATTQTEKRKRERTALANPKRARKNQRRCPELPGDVLDKILMAMVNSRDHLSVIKMSMVSRSYRLEVNANLKVWYRMYLHWRGPIRVPSHTPLLGNRGGVVSLRPTMPRSLPNFQLKTPSTS